MGIRPLARDVRDTSTAAIGGVVVTPHDSTNFAYETVGVFVGGAGNVTAVMRDGTVLLFTGVVAGTILPIRCQRINSTGTTATNMTALF